ncbi:hypothetical protein [Flavivirga jejuensis]|uniref:DUF4374 domain-containing protein n=1 Tax=Flavivirga jejuensis TaxID=870487 RepID=A0ABT8WT19_9FLAO|nr:hypothetical protein [Flavivirga jejuensis]MDO5976333.1 hypothetical protein [Flavivirga jejuensis]
MKTNNRWAWKTMLLIAIITTGFTSCKDDDTETTINDGDEKESAWVQNYSIEYPEGHVFYLIASEEPLTTIDISQGLELGSDVSTWFFEEYVYTIASSSATITKWSVDKVTLEFKTESVLSYASTGISATRSLVFLSETQAFLADLEEGVVMEWNPTTMKISNTYNVESALNGASSGLSMWATGYGFALNEKVAWPVCYAQYTCCENLFPQGGSTLGVFDPSSGSITYEQDNRILNAGYWPLTDINGNRFIQPNTENGFYYNYYDIDSSKYGSPYTLLKIDAEGNFDPSFEFNFSDVVPVTYGSNVVFAYKNQLVLEYDEVAWPDAYDDAWNWWGDESVSHTVLIDLASKAVEPYSALEGYRRILFRGNFDGINYYSGFIKANDKAVILKQNSVNDFTIVSTLDGGIIQNIGKLW